MTINTYQVTMENTRNGKVRRVTVKAEDRWNAEAIAEMNNRDHAAVDSKRVPEPVRFNRFPTMLGN